MKYDYVKGLALRFLRGALAGSIGSMAPIGLIATKFEDVKLGLSILILAGLSGGITGGLLSLDKFIRETIKE